jgi:glycine betaine/proline transport system substrate-binding protein
MLHSLKKTAMVLCICALSVLLFSPVVQAQDSTKPIKIGWTAWSDAEAITKIARQILEEKMGYDVELVMSDIGVQYQALKTGDIDIMLMSWLPVTHQNYWKKYAKDVVNLGPLYTRAKLGWVVPNYVPKDKVNSIEDLKDKDVAEKLENKITGIDPGAGLMQASEKAMKEYGLSKAGYDLVASSGAGMTAALARAIDKEEWIVVTGWSPHWKFAKWDLRYLEDPKGTLGGRERIHALTRKGFYQDVPYEVFEFFTRMYIPLSELEAVMLQASNSSYKDAVDTYIEEHPERVHYWMTGELK